MDSAMLSILVGFIAGVVSVLLLAKTWQSSTKRSSSDLQQELAKRDELIAKLKQTLTGLSIEKQIWTEKNATLERRIKEFDAARAAAMPSTSIANLPSTSEPTTTDRQTISADAYILDKLRRQKLKIAHLKQQLILVTREKEENESRIYKFFDEKIQKIQEEKERLAALLAASEMGETTVSGTADSPTPSRTATTDSNESQGSPSKDKSNGKEGKTKRSRFGRISKFFSLKRSKEIRRGPPVFGSSIEELLAFQSQDHSSLSVPVVLPTLVHAILSLDGLSTEGIFRISGNINTIQRLKYSVDRHQYDLLNDVAAMQALQVSVHDVASLLKMWLRELREPLVPIAAYDKCLSAGASRDANKVAEVIANEVPPQHRECLSFLVGFLRKFIAKETITKMTLENMAVCFSPCLLRCPSSDPMEILKQSPRERAFVETLLTNM